MVFSCVRLGQGGGNFEKEKVSGNDRIEITYKKEKLFIQKTCRMYEYQS